LILQAINKTVPDKVAYQVLCNPRGRLESVGLAEHMGLGVVGSVFVFNYYNNL
jgi:hypothetical protein